MAEVASYLYTNENSLGKKLNKKNIAAEEMCLARQNCKMGRTTFRWEQGQFFYNI